MKNSKQNPKVYFHCGLHKTGTTFLQKKVFPAMSEGSFIEPKAHRGIEGMLESMANAKSPLIISREGFSGHPFKSEKYENSQKTILNYISNTWPGSGLILVLREPSDLARSLYSQYLQSGGTDLFDDFLVTMKLEESFYYPRLIHSLESMNWGEVILFDYKQFATQPKEVIALLEKFVGCKFELSKMKDSKRENQSVKNNGAKLLRYANFIAPQDRFYNRKSPKFISAVLNKINLTPRYLIQDGPLKFLNNYGSSIISNSSIERFKNIYDESWRETLSIIQKYQNVINKTQY